MKLKFDVERRKYRPMLISIYGEHPDVYQDIREKWFEKNIKTPIVIALFSDEGIHDVYNESLQYCIDHKINFFIMIHQSVCPSGDWSLHFRSNESKRNAFFYTDNFVLVNVKKVRKYGFYRTIGKIKDFMFWITEKSKSEGYSYRKLNELEECFVKKANQLPDPERFKRKTHETKKKTRYGYRNKNKSDE